MLPRCLNRPGWQRIEDARKARACARLRQAMQPQQLDRARRMGPWLRRDDIWCRSGSIAESKTDVRPAFQRNEQGAGDSRAAAGKQTVHAAEQELPFRQFHHVVFAVFRAIPQPSRFGEDRHTSSRIDRACATTNQEFGVSEGGRASRRFSPRERSGMRRLARCDMEFARPMFVLRSKERTGGRRFASGRG